MKINLSIESENPKEIKELFAALSALGTPPLKVTGGATPAIPAEVKTDDAPSDAPEVTLRPEHEGQTLTPSQIKKESIAAEIIALGGTPPEKGAVKKFEEALEALKESAEATNGPVETETVETETVETETVETETVETETTETEETPQDDEVSLDDVRTLAHAVVKSTPDDPTLGKTKLGACLKAVGAANLTGATPAQLKNIVPKLEKNLGKTLEEVLAEAAE